MVSTQLPGIHNEDILISIFSYLPIMDLARCAAVCKHWHEVVTGSIYLWRGKGYTRRGRWRRSAEMPALLFALPLLHKFEVQRGPKYYVNFCYPYLSLSVADSSDWQAMRDWQKVRCTYFSIDLKIAVLFLSSHSPIDFIVLQKLKITKSRYRFIKPSTRPECVMSYALQRCPNIRELSIGVGSLSADYLDALEGMSRLRALKINCSGMQKLVFLRHCSEMLEELKLEGCYNVPSAAYAELGCLGNLQRLRLHYSHIEEGDLEVAAPGLRSLVSLELNMCRISDVSFLRHCGRLREVSIIVDICIVERFPRGLGQLPSSVRSLSLTASVRSLRLTVFAAIPDELSEALPRLPSLDQLSLSCGKLDRLDFLRGCPQLRHLRLRYFICPNRSELLNLRHLSQLETLDLPGTSDDLAVLSTVIPSLPQLDTLSVVYWYDGDLVGLLQNFPRLHSLSHFDNVGEFDFNLCGGKYVCKFVREIV